MTNKELTERLRFIGCLDQAKDAINRALKIVDNEEREYDILQCEYFQLQYIFIEIVRLMQIIIDREESLDDYLRNKEVEE